MEPDWRASIYAHRAAGQHLPARRPPRRAPACPPVFLAMLVLAAAAATWWAAPAAADPQPEPVNPPSEYTVKAAFLYGFGQFVEWPPKTFADPSAPFVIGVAGDDPFGGALDEIAAKRTIQGRRIVIRRFAAPDDYRVPCQILFVSRSLSADQQAMFLKKAEGQAVLTVGETPGFTEKGGIVNFFVEGDRIRFEINAETARAARLRMDAKLLSLGKPADASRPAAAN